MIRKPTQFIADYEFTSDITILSDSSKKSKKAKKVYSALDDFIDNIDDGKNDVTVSKTLTANVNINVLTEGMVGVIKKIDDESVVKGSKNKNGDERMTYVIKAEIFENNTTQHGSVLTLTGSVVKVRMHNTRTFCVCCMLYCAML